LAKATGAIVVGFSVLTDNETKQLAQQEKVIIKTYNIIYEMLEELDEVTTLIEEKEAAAKNLKGEAKVQAVFEIEGEKVYGLTVNKGKFALGDVIQVMRSENVFGKSKIISLKHRAKTISEVKKGEECGMIFSPALDIRAGDVVQCIL
jgi:translation initiation factor IF-2